MTNYRDGEEIRDYGLGEEGGGYDYKRIAQGILHPECGGGHTNLHVIKFHKTNAHVRVCAHAHTHTHTAVHVQC